MARIRRCPRAPGAPQAPRAPRGPRRPRRTFEWIIEERGHCLEKAEHLLDLLLDEAKVYKPEDRCNMLYRLHAYMMRLVKLPVSEIRVDREGQADLCERYDLFLAEELNEQRNGARVIGGWLSQYRRLAPKANGAQRSTTGPSGAQRSTAGPSGAQPSGGPVKKAEPSAGGPVIKAEPSSGGPVNEAEQSGGPVNEAEPSGGPVNEAEQSGGPVNEAQPSTTN